MRRLLLAALVPVALLVALVAPSGGQDADGRTVTVTMDEFTLTPDRTTVAAGTVEFVSRNTGKIEHELLVLRTDLAPGDLPLGLEGPAVDLAGKVVLGKAHTHHSGGGGGATSRHVQPGGELTEQVTLTPGDYVLLCSLPGHYEGGQRAALTVE